MVAGIVSTREADIALELFAHRDKYDEETVGRIGKLATVLRSWFGESCVDTSVSPYRLEFTFPSPSPDESVVYEIEAYFVAILEGNDLSDARGDDTQQQPPLFRLYENSTLGS